MDIVVKHKCLQTLEWVFNDPIDESLDDIVERVRDLNDKGYHEFIEEFREALRDSDRSNEAKFCHWFGGVVVDPTESRIKGLEDVPLMGAPIPKEVFLAVARSYWELLRRHDEPFPLDGVELE